MNPFLLNNSSLLDYFDYKIPSKNRIIMPVVSFKIHGQALHTFPGIDSCHYYFLLYPLQAYEHIHLMSVGRKKTY